MLLDRDEPTSSTTVYYSPFYSAHAEKPDTNLGEEREKSPKTEKLFGFFSIINILIPLIFFWVNSSVLSSSITTIRLLENELGTNKK